MDVVALLTNMKLRVGLRVGPGISGAIIALFGRRSNGARGIARGLVSVPKKLVGLIHSGPCQGMVAPAGFGRDGNPITEKELRALVHGALCMLCGEDVPDDQLEAAYV